MTTTIKTPTPTPTQAPPYDGITYVIGCGGAKRDRPARARDLYVGQMFRHTLANAERAAGMDTETYGRPARVLILSGRYGLVELDQVLQPYDQRMDAKGAVDVATLIEQAKALGIGWGAQVYALLPRPYLRRLDDALRTLDVYVQDVYEGCGGIGSQRRVNAHIGQPIGPAAGNEPDVPGLTVWVGGDVSAFWWGMRILVSYDRLRHAATPPVATAPWVLDSGAYKHLVKHRAWTVSHQQYAADITRYAEQIGRLVWAAPQDWPAGHQALNATGLTETEHQTRTTSSVRHLRDADTGVPIIPVLTGHSPAGFLRHISAYRHAGIDLHAEPLVGVGALLDRPASEAAEIVRLLHTAGLTRLHVFGGKGRLLQLVGDLITSIDSMGWSDQARRDGNRCPHDLVAWERNCPLAAQQWASRQRQLATRATHDPPAHTTPSRPQVDLWGPVLDNLLGSI